jgi:hypothetical protein
MKFLRSYVLLFTQFIVVTAFAQQTTQATIANGKLEGGGANYRCPYI